MRIMAFDYGTKRVGIAVTDPLQLIATALTTLHPDQVPAYLQHYLPLEPVERFVVGMPKQMDGSDSKTAQHVKGFIKMLKRTFPAIDVVTMDERFTSKMALATIAQSGLKKNKKHDKGLVDSIAAVIILQSYMEQTAFFKS